MVKGIYGLITALIVTCWSYFGPAQQVYARHRTPEERERAIAASTWTCQDCDRVNGVDKTRCRDCGTPRGFKTEDPTSEEESHE